MRKAAQIGAVGVVVALLGLLVWNLAHTDGGGVAVDVEKNKIVPAPTWTRKRLNADGELSLASLRGKVVVLNFWQSYCPPCADEAPTLVKAAKAWEGKNVVFVGIDVQDFKAPALKFMKKHGIEYPNVRDNGSLVGRYGVTGYPETFFVTPDGNVVPPHIVGPVERKQLDEGIRRAQTA